MPQNIRYTHTNIIAKDWRRLASFYIEVFQCKPIYPERDLKGDWIDKVTNIKNVHLQGMHLSLPGYTEGPTIEIFEYEPSNLCNEKPVINQQGLAHLAFHVDSVEAVLKKLQDNGGEQLGNLVVQEYEGIGILTVVYARDPEHNIVEIQNWKR